MGLTELRGIVVFAAVVVAIAVSWNRLDDEPTTDAAPAPTTSTTTTTSSVPTSSTTDPLASRRQLCDLSVEFAAAAQTAAPEQAEAVVTRLAAEFWEEVLVHLTPEARVDAAPVADHFESYLEVAEPFDFDPVRIITEGDKERYEQLLTRPATGLDESRAHIATECGIEVPDKAWMAESTFADLEDRLLDPDPLQRPEG